MGKCNVGFRFCLGSVLSIYFDCFTYLNGAIHVNIFYDAEPCEKTRCHITPLPSAIKATSLQWWLSSVPRVAFVRVQMYVYTCILMWCKCLFWSFIQRKAVYTDGWPYCWRWLPESGLWICLYWCECKARFSCQAWFSSLKALLLDL